MIHLENSAARNAPSSPASPAPADAADLISWPLVVARTIPLDGRHVRLRLETAVWDGLDAIAAEEGRGVRDLCGELNAARPANTPLTSAIRNHVLAHFRNAAQR
ncbi:putative DNA-binding ribbon-helix-helix protein [Azospirillum agricola]|uniref:ribbon-helix-helix domain-containing protein n=1 Tax=Azospirillum agricola TaxID=1720247 RepID=UPI001AE4D9BA|nr:ribbon-helix-helix domain-containing protein [Azospirillum agricola]MBP2230558.1 putative DNA-binding ribbon-helix-helix protein [Azospirillum agricola]